MSAATLEAASCTANAAEGGTAEQLMAEAQAAGKTMAFEGFPRLVPIAYRHNAASWLAGFDQAEADLQEMARP